jgi:hypothetical protein
VIRYVSQLVASAQAAVDEAVRRGVCSVFFLSITFQCTLHNELLVLHEWIYGQ